MNVPQALADRLEDIDRRCEAAETKVREAQALHDKLVAMRNELEVAIEIIERHAPTTPELPERVSISEYLDARAPAPISSPEPSRQRRDIKKLVIGYLEGGSGAAKNIAAAIGAQRAQIDKVLAKLAEEDRAEQSADGFWRLRGEAPSVGEAFAQLAEEDRVDRPAVFEAADIISFLNARPEGASLAEIEKQGLSVKEAMEFREAWLDSRGYYHATVRAPGEDCS